MLSGFVGGFIILIFLICVLCNLFYLVKAYSKEVEFTRKTRKLVKLQSLAV